MTVILLILCIFLQLIHQPRNALNKIQFMTSIKLLHVSAPGCHPQEISLEYPGAETCRSLVLVMTCILLSAFVGSCINYRTWCFGTEIAQSSHLLVSFNQAAWRHILEGSNFTVAAWDCEVSQTRSHSHVYTQSLLQRSMASAPCCAGSQDIPSIYTLYDGQF